MGMTGAGTILAHEHVAPPMVADFHPAPMSANEFQPLGWCVLAGRGAGKVVARFGGGQAGLFARTLAAQDDQGPGKGKVGRQGLDGEGLEPPGFDAAMAGLGVGKKGVSGKASKPWACLSRLGWLPLI